MKTYLDAAKDFYKQQEDIIGDMEINVRLKKNFITAYNKMQDEFGTEVAQLNGFADEQLSYTDFISSFIDTKVVADASIDGNSNVSKKDMVTLLNEMPKPDDAADAIAIALCHARSSTSLLAKAQQKP
jgi:Holliday junction resolvasome RuvABC endonuclease subunit